MHLLTPSHCHAIDVTESLGEWAGPYACLDLPSILVDKGLALDQYGRKTN